jgi:hypothetical protein
MLKATIIWTKENHTYYNAFGEQFYLDEFYELELPFYACHMPSHHDSNMILAAFQEKKDLIDWMNTPILKNLNRKKQLIEDIARENMEKFAMV